MKRRRFVLSVVYGLAVILLCGNSVKAQGYFIGYYYPQEKRFSGPRLSTGISDQHKISGMWNPVFQNSTSSAPIGTTSTSMRVPMQTTQANVRVILPDSQAVVWFGDYQTKSTGTDRVYQTPALQPGSYNYQIKVSYVHDGQQLSLERTVAVTPGQTIVLDLSATSTALKKPAQ